MLLLAEVAALSTADAPVVLYVVVGLLSLAVYAFAQILVVEGSLLRTHLNRAITLSLQLDVPDHLGVVSVEVNVLAPYIGYEFLGVVLAFSTHQVEELVFTLATNALFFIELEELRIAA